MAKLKASQIDPTIGLRSHRLLTVQRHGSSKHGEALYLCDCDCGKSTIAKGKKIRSKLIQSCGCANGRKPISPDWAAFGRLYSDHVFRAKSKSLPFTLTREQFRAITSAACRYCGVTPSQIRRATKSKSTYTYNGIDRIENSLGYTAENSAPACGVCNNAKASMSVKEFMAWASRLSSHLKL